MGLRYVIFRTVYELKRKYGNLRKKYPVHVNERRFITLSQWREIAKPFFFESREHLIPYQLPKDELEKLKIEVNNVKTGNLKFFNANHIDLGTSYDWVTNPDTGYHYNSKTHWTEVPDMDPRNGDIKYVWEKSRFSFLYTAIRYDYHSLNDQADYVFGQILDWLEFNPLNSGPNYKCSQEISLRLMNWTFALYYYRNSEYLTEDVFQKIINAIYRQTQHVEKNINFSRIAVRNNHALTECLLLYIIGITFPYFPCSKRWKRKGKNFFEKEIRYQVYKDGTFLQFSMNYQRVAVQLFTWYLALSEKHKMIVPDTIKERIASCLNFMIQHQDEETGKLPNYGANDGALFFPLNNQEYRDYRPQLNALNYALNKTNLYESSPCIEEDIFWLFNQKNPELQKPKRKTSAFNSGGFYILRKKDSFLTIRCASFKDRPSQADNLHIDLWKNGVNLLRDAGSYKYNTKKEDLAYFMGTASHNTVMIGDFDQMLKGGRFIWYFWPKAIKYNIEESSTQLTFEGAIKAFRQVGHGITHHRKIQFSKLENELIVMDRLENKGDRTIHQIWHPHPDFEMAGMTFESFNATGESIERKMTKGYFSEFYGVKEEVPRILFSTKEDYIKTIIKY